MLHGAPCLCLRGATPLGVVCQRRGLVKRCGGNQKRKKGNLDLIR